MSAVDALHEAACIFERYAALHDAKGTMDGAVKAKANRDAANMCHVAISAEHARERAEAAERALMHAERDAFCAELAKQRPAITAIFDRGVWDAVTLWKEGAP